MDRVANGLATPHKTSILYFMMKEKIFAHAQCIITAELMNDS
jgi:hypothetical protein